MYALRHKPTGLWARHGKSIKIKKNLWNAPSFWNRKCDVKNILENLRHKRYEQFDYDDGDYFNVPYQNTFRANTNTDVQANDFEIVEFEMVNNTLLGNVIVIRSK